MERREARMKITVLVENTTRNPVYIPEHGLSLHIETKKHKVLFDTGASSCFLQNAEKLGVNLKEVDIMILSHGHYDHGGGLKAFLELNTSAKIYINQLAFGAFFSQTENSDFHYIGLDLTTKDSDQIVFTAEDITIDNELELFMKIQPNKYFPSMNNRLFRKDNNQCILDTFDHEQSLVIHDGDKHLLIAGCAHTGIVNIVEQINQRSQYKITHIVSGFHMYNRKENKSEDPNMIAQVGEFLKEQQIEAYTGHCTGEVAYEQLSKILGMQLNKLYTGQIIKV
jgi:7,8-dihydropterin-6-yl-methyl-4-(beta-D-ribofuranosyl)aminobenzene 5'-phosphate synthase